jgi:hypothetical protein
MHTHTPKPIYEQVDVTVLWNQGVHTDREVTVNRSDIVIKNKRDRTRILIDGAINTSGHNCHAKGSRKGTKIQEFMYRDTTNVEHDVHGCTGNNWRDGNSNSWFEGKFVSRTGKIFSRFTTEEPYWNVTRNTERTAV